MQWRHRWNRYRHTSGSTRHHWRRQLILTLEPWVALHSYWQANGKAWQCLFPFLALFDKLIDLRVLPAKSDFLCLLDTEGDCPVTKSHCLGDQLQQISQQSANSNNTADKTCASSQSNIREQTSSAQICNYQWFHSRYNEKEPPVTIQIVCHGIFQYLNNDSNCVANLLC